MRTQVAPRPVGVLQGLTASVNPVALCPSYREIAQLPLAERVAALRDPERRGAHRRRAPDVRRSAATGSASTIFTGFDKLFPMEEPVNYEPSAVLERRGTRRCSRRLARSRRSSTCCVEARRPPAAAT